jgi:hypothetical protein
MPVNLTVSASSLPRRPSRLRIVVSRSKIGNERKYPVSRYAVGKKAQPATQQRFETILIFCLKSF